MPLLYIDLIKGRTPSEVRTLVDAIHDAVVDAFEVPPGDRYQVVHTHPLTRSWLGIRALASTAHLGWWLCTW